MAEGCVRWLGPLPDDLSSWIRNPLNQEDLIGKSVPAKQVIIGYRVLWSITNKVIEGRDPDAPQCLSKAMKMMEEVFAKYMGSPAPKDMSYLDMVNVTEKAYPPG